MIKVLLLNLLLSNSFFSFQKNNDTLEINDINKINLELLNRKIDSVINEAISLKAFPGAQILVIKDGNKISGLVGYWRDSGRFVLFNAKAIIFATGGGGKAWKVTSNSWEYTGDGLGMAYRAGAELIDIEFKKSHAHLSTCWRGLGVLCFVKTISFNL